MLQLNRLKPDDSTKGSFATIINTFVMQANQKEAENKLDNIQVIRRTKNDNGNWEYRVNILSAELLGKFKQCKKSLQQLITISPRLHRMTINEVLDGKNLYPLLYRQYRGALKDKRSPCFVYTDYDVCIIGWKGERLYDGKIFKVCEKKGV